MDKTKILFAGHDLKFARQIIEFYESVEHYEVKMDQWTGHSQHNEDQSERSLAWADVIFCEWGLGNAVWYSKHKRPDQVLVVRVHRQELDTDYPNQFTMKNINAIIAISPYIYEEFARTFRLPREKMHMIYNFVDTEAFTTVKQANYRYHLGIVGILPKMKRLDKALDVFSRLWEIDSRYRLFIKGKMPQDVSWLWNREEERDYYEALFKTIEESPWGENVHFDGFGNDIPEWLQKIGYTFSVSDFESFHLAPAEGMASGAYPLVLDWEGSETIYDPKYILSSTEEMVDRVLKRNSKPTDDREILRLFIKLRFDLKTNLKQVYELINKISQESKCKPILI